MSDEVSDATSDEYLPAIYERFRGGFPAVAGALDSLAVASEVSGPLDERTRRLVKLGIAVGMSSEGAVRSNTRKALALGCSENEIEHVAVLAVTTGGFPAAIAAFSWMAEVFAAPHAPPRRG